MLAFFDSVLILWATQNDLELTSHGSCFELVSWSMMPAADSVVDLPPASIAAFTTQLIIAPFVSYAPALGVSININI